MDVRQMIIDLRGGVPANCDFCGKETPEDNMHPEEAGMWICITCIDTDPASYFGSGAAERMKAAASTESK